MASILLHTIENASGPLATPFLVQVALGEGYSAKTIREATWHNLQMLEKNGYIRQHRKGRGSRPATWVPTISRIPAPKTRNRVAGRIGKG